jgi:hypothetical protein
LKSRDGPTPDERLNYGAQPSPAQLSQPLSSALGIGIAQALEDRQRLAEPCAGLVAPPLQPVQLGQLPDRLRDERRLLDLARQCQRLGQLVPRSRRIALAHILST